MKGITEEYRKLNERLHADRPDYGVGGGKWAEKVARLAQQWDAKTCVDFGAGKGMLKNTLRRISPLQVENYDPAVPEFATPPAPADMVVCTDVLEHIEPTCLTDVLEHIQELANIGGFLNIACRPAKKVLADGRNAHLIVREPIWWFDNLREYFDIVSYDAFPGEVNIVFKRLGTVWS